MTSPHTPQILEPELRQRLLAEPALILEDPALMGALVQAREASLGGNVVDLRGIAMDRLQARLGDVEETYRDVVAAAYDNLAGTQQVHRAVVALLEPEDPGPFLEALQGDVAQILRVDVIRLVFDALPAPLKAHGGADSPLWQGSAGFVRSYLGAGPAGGSGEGAPAPLRAVTLRPVPAGAEHTLYAGAQAPIRSEACLHLDAARLGGDAILCMGSLDGERFTAQQGTELLSFFAEVFENAVKRWLT